VRIAQVAPLYESVPPRLYGGTERVVSWLTEELVALGHQVTLFASGDSVTKARLVPGCKKALRLDTDSVDPLPHHLIMLENVYRRASDFDLIHFHVDYLPFSLTRREPVPALSTLHGRLDLPDLVPLYKHFAEVKLISISDAQRTPLPWANWQGTVHHGLPKDSLCLGPGTGGYLAFLGRISPEKGVDLAIEIARRSGLTLKIAAKVDRVDRAYFDSKIEPQIDGRIIQYIGEIGHAEKSDFLGNAAALLFPIQWPEPFGIVMIESIACGTPIIAFPCGSVPEIVSHGISGFIVKDVDSAVDAVSRIGEIDRSRCRKHFERHFTVERMVREYLQIYRRLVRGESPAITIDDGALKWNDVAALPPGTTT